MKIRFWHMVAWISISLISTFELLGWRPFIAPPDQRAYTDFIAFYAAGRVAQLHGYSKIYNIDYQQQVEQSVAAPFAKENVVLLYNHMPYLAPILGLMVDNNYSASLLRWAFLLAVIYIASTIFLIKWLFSSAEQRSQFVLGLGILTFFPVFLSLSRGQDTAVLFLGVGIWCMGIIKKRDWTAAVGLTLTLVRPQICIVLALPLLLDQRRIMWRFVLLGSILALTSFLLIGWQGSLDYLNILKISSAGKWFGMRPDAMVNLYGVVVRSLGYLASGISWIIYFVGILGVMFVWQNWKSSKEFLLGLVILLSILSVPHLQNHDLTLLLFPLLFFLQQKIGSPHFMIWALLPIAASFLLIAGYIFPALTFVIPYVLMAALGYAMIGTKSLFPVKMKNG